MSRKIHSSAILFVCAVFWLKFLHAAPVNVERTISQPPSSEPSNEVPQFLLDIYDCWQSGKQDCLPIADPEVNVVRTILGHVDEQDTELTGSVAVTFNSSTITGEVVHAAVLRVPKHALTELKLKELKSECDLSNLRVVLHSNVSSPENPRDVVVIEKDIPMSSMLGKTEWLSFTNAIEPFKEGLNSITIRLAIEGSCSLSSTDLGIDLEKPELVAYLKSDVQNSMLSDIVNEQRRKKRQASTGSGDPNAELETPTKQTPKPTTVPTTNAKTEQPTQPVATVPKNINDYLGAPICQLFDFTVDFQAIGSGDYIVRPLTYNAHLCAGDCRWPLSTKNYTRHSYVQSLVNDQNADLVPPPCCAPYPDRMGTLAVVIKESADRFSTQLWYEMVATTCGCL